MERTINLIGLRTFITNIISLNYKCESSSNVERLSSRQEVGGSYPSSRSNYIGKPSIDGFFIFTLVKLARTLCHPMKQTCF